MIERYFEALWNVMLDLSPSLLLGLVIAGALHVLIPGGMIRRGLNKPNIMSVSRSVLIGVPMPLCSPAE
jgi:uncharacterized membrane protein YraQ (UPF0718 family)